MVPKQEVNGEGEQADPALENMGKAASYIRTNFVEIKTRLISLEEATRGYGGKLDEVSRGQAEILAELKLCREDSQAARASGVEAVTRVKGLEGNYFALDGRLGTINTEVGRVSGEVAGLRGDLRTRYGELDDLKIRMDDLEAGRAPQPKPSGENGFYRFFVGIYREWFAPIGDWFK